MGHYFLDTQYLQEGVAVAVNAVSLPLLDQSFCPTGRTNIIILFIQEVLSMANININVKHINRRVFG